MNIKTKITLTLVTTLLLSVLLLPIAQARPMYQPQLKPLESCNVCHVNQGGGGPMNVFGADWVSNGKKFQNIAKLDSDGDGFTNEQELKDKTYPGDPNSNRNARSSFWIFLIISIVVIAATVAIFVAAAKVQKNEESVDR